MRVREVRGAVNNYNPYLHTEISYFRFPVLILMQIPRISFLLLLLPAAVSISFAQQTFPVNGVHDERHTVFAFVNATIAVDYKTITDSASMTVRDGIILEAGRSISIPPGAVVIDLKGKYIYPSFIDLYSDYGMPEVKKPVPPADGSPQLLSGTRGAYGWNQAIKPETDAINLFTADPKKADELRKLGFGTVMTHYKDGIARGTAVLAALSDEKENTSVMKDRAAACYSFDKGSSAQEYPSSLMGVIALIRQTHLDAQWYKGNAGKEEYNISLDAWNKNAVLPQVFETGDKLSALRAAKIGKEFGVKYIIKGAGDEYQRLAELQAAGNSFIIPLSFPAPYDVEDPYDALQVPLGDMKHWEMAPLNPAAMEKARIPFALTAADLKDKKDFLKNIRKAIENGLSEQQALRALTVTPAEMLNLSGTIGSLKNGMTASFIITSGKIFDADNVILENWVQGKRYSAAGLDAPELRGSYELQVKNLPLLKLRAAGDFLNPSFFAGEDTAKNPVTFSRMGNLISLQFEIKKSSFSGQVRLSGYIEKDGLWKGEGETGAGEKISWTARRTAPYIPVAKKDTARKEKDIAGTLSFPNKAFGWKEIPPQETVLIKNATVWTNEKEGVLRNSDVLVSGGKIKMIGPGLEASPEYKSGGYALTAKVIDGTGLHLTPGIIDEHSHIAISRGVNEGTQAVTSEVRIGDVVNSDDINIYRQLAGGVTTSHLLHGSANPIGGQTQLIKLRWGFSPEKMKFEDADGFIKFALGENVKQANWGDKNVIRFPQTRMGVEQVYMDAFTRAREYRMAWDKYNSLSGKGRNPSPRKDLELEALSEILAGKRFITCHSYVQSEINMLMHVADSFGFRVNTFTHILEGYKVAGKLKQHGAAASTFSDWWAYKYEVMEAIPYNGAILHNMGIVTGFNSDDAEMGRRLNQEAAKAVKYGNVPEEEALKFVTLNPAVMLHVDDRVGSIRKGKDADLVLWSHDPLSVYARVLKTFVDGRVFFDSDKDAIAREEIRREKARIIRKMIEAKKNGEKTQKPLFIPDDLYHCETLGQP